MLFLADGTPTQLQVGDEIMFRGGFPYMSVTRPGGVGDLYFAIGGSGRYERQPNGPKTWDALDATIYAIECFCGVALMLTAARLGSESFPITSRAGLRQEYERSRSGSEHCFYLTYRVAAVHS